MVTYSVSVVLLPVFVVSAAWVSNIEMFPVISILVVSVMFLFLVFFFSVRVRLQQENMLLTTEGKRYEELRNYMDETRTLRHDFRQHILVMTQLSGAGKFSELQSYLQQFSVGTEANYTRYCDNVAVDAVASHYTAFAESQSTKIDWRMTLSHDLPMKESDYCVILGNLLENALKAVKNLSEERRKITVISSLLSETIIGLSVDNPSQDILNNAAELQSFLGFPEWLNFVGVGEADGRPCIYIYVNKKKVPRSEIPDSWCDMPVKVRYIGKIRPA